MLRKLIFRLLILAAMYLVVSDAANGGDLASSVVSVIGEGIGQGFDKARALVIGALAAEAQTPT